MTDLGLLRDEVTLLERSLDDARSEHARGELTDDALAAIERRDGARLADARRRLEALDEPPHAAADAPERGGAGATARRRRPRWLLVVGVGCLLVAGLVLGLAAADPFATTRPLGPATRPTEVEGLLILGQEQLAEHHPRRAVTAFDAALRLAPRDAEAMVEGGWVRYEYLGVPRRDVAEEDRGAAMLRRAVRLAPRDAAGHLYDGLVLYQHDHDPAAARAQVLEAAALPESAYLVAVTDATLACFDQRRCR